MGRSSMMSRGNAEWLESGHAVNIIGTSVVCELTIISMLQQTQMAVMNLSSNHSQFPQMAEWTQWLCDA